MKLQWQVTFYIAAFDMKLALYHGTVVTGP